MAPQLQLTEAIRAAGLTPPDTIIADGEVHRFSSNGNPNDDAGWYVLRTVNGSPVLAGAFGDYRSGINQKFRSDAGRPLTRAEETHVRESVEASQRKRAAEQKAAAARSNFIWQAIKAARRPSYLKRKGIGAHGARQQGNVLIIPAYNSEGRIQSIQQIYPDGTKRFLKGSSYSGCFFPIGPTDSQTICIVEGFATGASVHEATGHAVIVAFNAGNLLAVAKVVRQWYPDRQLVICGDDDKVGRAKALEAARAVGARVAFPEFGDNRPDGAKDFNDQHQALGPDAVRSSCEAAAAPSGADDNDAWPAPVDFVARGTPHPPRAIMELLFAGYVTLLSAHGGAGKSSIALFLAACIALRLSWWGFPVEQRKVLFLSCEDRADVLHWRLHHICNFLGVDISDLEGRLVVMDLVGYDAVLYTSDSRGSGPTPNYRVLKTRIELAKIEVLIIDGATDVLAINENDRGAVKRGINALAALVPVDTGAVLLIAHIDKSSAKGASTRETYSGSTAWHNGVRVRASIIPIVKDEGERTGKQLLEVHKSNYGPAGAQIEFEWSPEAHLFVGKPLTAATLQERSKQEQEEREALLNVLRLCTAAGVVVPAACVGPRTAFAVLSAHAAFPEALKAGAPGRRRFWKHMEALRMRGDVFESDHVRANRHRTVQLLARELSNKPSKF